MQGAIAQRRVCRQNEPRLRGFVSNQKQSGKRETRTVLGLNQWERGGTSETIVRFGSIPLTDTPQRRHSTRHPTLLSVVPFSPQSLMTLCSTSRGVVGRLSGFSCAVTQFLDAEAMCAVSSVCRQDLVATDQIFLLCQRLLADDGDAANKTGCTLGQVLWLQRHPVCFAFAHLQALRMLRVLLEVPEWNRRSLILGTDHPFEATFYCGIEILSTSKKEPKFAISRDVDARDLYSGLMKPILVDLIPSLWVHRNDTRECANLLLRYLSVAGPLLTFVMTEHDALLEAFATLWFALDVAPRLTVESASHLTTRSGSLLARYRDRIDYRLI